MSRKDAVVVEEFEHKGYRCIVAFSFQGIHTGYVELPPGHRYHGREWDEHPFCHFDGAVHGGITWSDGFLPKGLEAKEGHWYVGMDCGHSSDKRDPDKAVSLGLITKEESECLGRKLDVYNDFCEMLDGCIPVSRPWATFKDAEFAHKEVEEIASLISEFVSDDEEGNNNNEPQQ